jgi:hypothetical protein
MREHLEHVGRLMLAHRQAQTAATKSVKEQTSATRHGSRGKPAPRSVPRANREDTI